MNFTEEVETLAIEAGCGEEEKKRVLDGAKQADAKCEMALAFGAAQRKMEALRPALESTKTELEGSVTNVLLGWALGEHPYKEVTQVRQKIAQYSAQMADTDTVIDILNKKQMAAGGQAAHGYRIIEKLKARIEEAKKRAEKSQSAAA